MTPLIVILLYLGITFSIGTYAWWRGRVTADDYYISARSQGYLVTALAIMATFFSSFAMLGAPGMLYKGGIGFVFFMLNVPICGALIWIIGRPLWSLGKRHGYITPSDLVADYFSSDTLRVLVALLGFIYIIPYAVIQFKGGGYLFEVITRSSDVHLGFFTLVQGKISLGPFNISTHDFGAVLLASITMVYTIMGGMRAVCWTDVFQGGLLVIGMIVGGIITIFILGGVAGLFGQAAAVSTPGHPAGEFITLPGPAGMFPVTMIFTFVLVASFGTMASPGQWMRYYSAKNPDALRKSMIIFAVVLTACYFFGTTFIGLGGRVLFPELAQADTVYLVILEKYLPLVLASFFVTTIMAAAMSTANGNLHALSALITNDIYRRFLRPGGKAGQRELVWVGRTVITAASIVSLWIALQPDIGMIFKLGMVSIAVSMQMFPSLIGPLFWKGATRAGTVAGIILGMAVLLVTFMPEKFGITAFGISPLGIHYGFWGFTFNLAALYVVSRFTRPPSRETVERFHTGY
ncbi:MAG: sodium:solute symporter family protein [Candidatus Glassbacteria bacterium]|nr:sodium:solute symporter family protein [Candidatus Glassbacteria bacterium]